MKKILVILILLSSCTLTQYAYDPIYEDHPHSTEVYYNGIDVYWGYHTGFYYYYGIPHFYPWWYYYQLIPPYHYHIHTHIIIDCKPGHYVYGHRGPKFHNTGPDCKINHGKFTPTVKVRNDKDKSFVFPRDWKSHNSTRNNKQNNVKYNINKINYDRTFNLNNSNVNKINNKSNNIRNTNKNRSNNKQVNRPKNRKR
jgi:hypothetical protein